MSEVEAIKPAQVLVPISNEGKFLFSNQQELGKAAALAIQMRNVPEHLIKEGREAVMSAMIMCKQFGLPDKAMNEMAFVKGKLTCYGSLVTALAERHEEYGEKQEFFVDEKQNVICSENKNLNAPVYAAVVKVKKKNSNVWSEYYFTIDEAKQAGLLTEKTFAESPWRKYTKEMLSHKARARALRAEYASALNGIEYHEDVQEIYDVTPREIGTANDLNNEFNGGNSGGQNT